MHVISWCSIVFVISLLISQIETVDRDLRISKKKGFLLYRKYSITQRPCKCSTTFSCSCCETVTLLYTKRRRELCSNFVYQRNGLNVDISLDMDTLRTTTITNYRPFKICSAIPGSLFSTICVNVTELNQFPRSLTVCVRHDITSKTQEWQIDYTCVSISTELPAAMSSTARMSSPGMTSPASDEPPTPQETTQKPPEPDISPNEEEKPPEMQPEEAMAPEPVSPEEEPDAEKSAALASPTAIVGVRKRRGTTFRKSNIVNANDNDDSELNTGKLKTPGQPRNVSIINYHFKLPFKVPNFPPNNVTSADEPLDEALPVSKAIGRNVFHNRTEHFPNRIPPFIAKSMNNETNTPEYETFHEIMAKNSTTMNKSDKIIFPD